jgi:hypothetical protein
MFQFICGVINMLVCGRVIFFVAVGLQIFCHFLFISCFLCFCTRSTILLQNYCLFMANIVDKTKTINQSMDKRRGAFMMMMCANRFYGEKIIDLFTRKSIVHHQSAREV